MPKATESNNRTFELASPKLKGSMRVVYGPDGYLLQLDMMPSTAILSAEQWQWLLSNLPLYLNDGESLVLPPSSMQITELSGPMKEGQRRVSTWCRIWVEHFGTKYRATGMESRALADPAISVTGELVRFYLNLQRPWCEVKSITNYVRHFNHLMQAVHGMVKYINGTKAMPNKYDAAFEAGLNVEELKQYHAHLRELGFKRHTTPGAGAVWVKEGGAK